MEVIDSTVLPMVEGHVRFMVAPAVDEVVGAHIESQRTNAFTTPDQSVLERRLFCSIESVFERRLGTLAVPGASFEICGPVRQTGPAQVLPADTKATL